MNQNTRKNLITLFIIIAISVVGYAIYHHYQDQNDRKQESVNLEQQVKIRREHTIKQLASKYGAIIDWDKNINYTLQLQRLLIDKGRPILFTGNPIDVFRKGDKYYVRFLKPANDFGSSGNFFFTLKCNPGIISMILNKQPSKEDEFSPSDIDLWLSNIYLQEKGSFAVVAKINKITKPSLQITGSPDGEGDVDFEYNPSSSFILQGRCISVSYLGN